MCAHADIAAITSQNADRLTLVDTDTLETLASVPLPGKPAAVAVDGPRGRVLAVSVDTATLHVFDLSGRALATFPLGGAPLGLAIRPETGMALVTDWTGFLREIDPATGAEVRRWPVGATPSGVAVARVAVGRHPFGVTLHGGHAFVTNVLGNSVSVIDLDTDTVTATIPVGERPYAVAFAAGRGFVTNQYGASITVFDAVTYGIVGEIATGDYPEGIAATADGRRILVANWFSDNVQVIDAGKLAVVETLHMPAGPRAFGNFIAAVQDNR
ncbi:MAG: YncE family protein [Gemmobacter sp.]